MIKLKSKTPVIASELRLDGGERSIASNGEINALNKKDLLQQQQKLMTAVSSGLVASAEERQTLQAEHMELVKAAFNDKEAHRVLGERMADEFYMTANRKGYMRRLMARNELKQGDIPRFPVRAKNVTAMIATGPTRTETQITQDKWMMPPEFQVFARPFIPENELNQSNTDVLNEKYIEGLEGLMVTEDRIWYNLAMQTVNIDNSLSVISGQMTPSSLMAVNMKVQRWGLKVNAMLMAADLIVDIIGNADFIQAIEPVARHELVMTGQMGVLYGMPLISEQYRHPEHKVLNEGEFFIVSDPQTHGAYSDRGGVSSEPINTATDRVIGRGWLMYESMAMSIVNSRSVAVAKRT
jgi:hypothetical protein